MLDGIMDGTAIGCTLGGWDGFYYCRTKYGIVSLLGTITRVRKIVLSVSVWKISRASMLLFWSQNVSFGGPTGLLETENSSAKRPFTRPA